MIYKTILKNGVYEFEERRSIFIGYSMRVENEEDARQFINDIRCMHSDARHNVYGYIIGENLNLQRYSDDGEPQGTAGIPVINTIKNNNLTNIVVVVTRYFGGILLGTGGLARAYAKSAHGTIKNANIVTRVLGNELKLRFKYELLGKIQYFLNKNNVHVNNIVYGENVVFEVRCDKEQMNGIKYGLIEVSSNNLDIEIGEDVMYFKDDGKYYLFDEV